jgi:hypothetical protein
VITITNATVLELRVCPGQAAFPADGVNDCQPIDAIGGGIGGLLVRVTAPVRFHEEASHWLRCVGKSVSFDAAPRRNRPGAPHSASSVAWWQQIFGLHSRGWLWSPVGRRDLKVERGFRPPVGACRRRAGDLKVGGKWADLAANRVSQRQTVKSCVWRLRRSAARTVKQCQATAGAQCTTGVSQRSQVQILPPLPNSGSVPSGEPSLFLD